MTEYLDRYPTMHEYAEGKRIKPELTDLISRADALEQMAQAECGLHYADCEADSCSCSYIQRILDIPSAELPKGELISRADAIAYIDRVINSGLGKNKSLDYIHKYISALPSAKAEQTMTKKVREALIRLTMCAREECDMCKYKDKCGFEFQYNISTENMNTILDALSADTVSREEYEELYRKAKEVNEMANDILADFPSYKELVSTDAAQGEWYQIKDHKVMGEGYMWHCSICDYKVYQDSSADYPSENFCPNCGARMKGGDDK